MPLRDRFDDAKRRRIIDRIKLHIEMNKEIYLVGAGCLYVGYTFGNHRSAPITNTASPVFNNMPVISPVFNNTVNNIGPTCKIIKRLEDGAIWEKSVDAARQLAEEQGITLEKAKWLISRNANGHIPHVYGMHYENFGLRTTG